MSDLRSLIEAAKADAPNAAARAKVWAGVSTVVGEGAALAGGGAVSGSAGATKMLVLGTLLGGSLTVGIGAALLLMRGASPGPAVGATIAAPAPGEVASPFVLAAPAALSRSSMLRRAAIEVPVVDDDTEVNAVNGVNAAKTDIAARGPARAVRLAEPGRRTSAGRSFALVAAAPIAPATPAAAVAVPGVAASAAQDDALAREASLLAEARNALARRDALSALQIIRGLRSMPTRQLIPEELAVEAQALRSLGLEDDANAVDTTLRARFPDSVLGR
jgi:hypothetical protein